MLPRSRWLRPTLILRAAADLHLSDLFGNLFYLLVASEPAGYVSGMLRDLQLCDFRCFDRLVFEPSAGLNLVTAANAQGKSTLLEAACILLRLQSPRASSLAEAVRFGRSGFALDGHWDDRHLSVKFVNSLKAFTLDSKLQPRSADYLAVAKVSWISNDDILLVRGPASHRRRFLDFLGAQVVPGYLRQLRAYERALRSRNALLKENRPRREIDAFDEPLLKAGEILLTTRSQLCLDLEPRVAEALTVISSGAETLKLIFQPGAPANFPEALQASRDEEMRLRTTIVGPHRDDIEILVEGRDAAAFASEGQQRSLALAMKLGQAGRLEDASESPPLFLIDDVFGELDPIRRNNLLAALPSSAQKLVTATTLHWMELSADAVEFVLENGKIMRKN
jgi:DNA replication and repair protein RecF